MDARHPVDQAHDDAPERIVLGPRLGVTPSEMPPVRIFVGSEPAQYRAERVFLWSIERVRDPSRTYEIHLMKGLTGFSDRKWLTGFTNYRFAVPHWAGGSGRAIYNDVDQAYLRDPAELFDLPLKGHGFLAISPRDTSVMLIDCRRMAQVWTLDDARTMGKNRLIDRALAVPDAHGTLDPRWNARDHEADARAACVHFTTLHRQPWRPFPGHFVYQPNPVAEVFHDLEREALAVGFNVFARERPSRHLGRALQRPPSARRSAAQALADPDVTSVAPFAESLLVVTGDGPRTRDAGSAHCEEIGLAALLSSSAVDDRFDGIVCDLDLERAPPDDLPWILDTICGLAARFVCVFIPPPALPPEPRRRRPEGIVGTIDWWAELLEGATARRPELHWRLLVGSGPERQFRQGGCRLDPSAPRVWVIEDHKPGHSTQSVGLAQALGLHYRRVDAERAESAARAASWPDLVISAGARCAPAARAIAARARGRTRTVQIGRKGAAAEDFDLCVSPAFAGLHPHPRRLLTLGPLTRVSRDALDRAAAQWRDALVGAPAPRIAVLVGGEDSHHRFDVNCARRMGERIRAMVTQAGGSILLSTSRRTPPASARALVDALGDRVAHRFIWSETAEGAPNPYLAYLALADAVVVTGESASQLMEAAATGKPVHIIALGKRRWSPRAFAIRLGNQAARAIIARAGARPQNRRGFERPQRGLERICARLWARGKVRPMPEIEALHRALIDAGHARYFDGRLFEVDVAPLDETAVVAFRVRRLLGIPPA